METNPTESGDSVPSKSSKSASRRTMSSTTIDPPTPRKQISWAQYMAAIHVASLSPRSSGNHRRRPPGTNVSQFPQTQRVINHFSHIHPLRLVPPSQDGRHNHHNSQCCEQLTDHQNKLGFADPEDLVYGCKPCDFFIHKACSELSYLVKHPSHPFHTLTLVLFTPYLKGSMIKCHGCQKPLSTGFFYHCTQCNYDLHTRCALLPQRISHGAHEHPLSLTFKHFFSICDICKRNSNGVGWLYCCPAGDFDAHIHCANSSSPSGGGSVGSGAGSRQWGYFGPFSSADCAGHHEEEEEAHEICDQISVQEEGSCRDQVDENYGDPDFIVHGS